MRDRGATDKPAARDFANDIAQIRRPHNHGRYAITDPKNPPSGQCVALRALQIRYADLVN
jgi:hypothetical protein